MLDRRPLALAALVLLGVLAPPAVPAFAQAPGPSAPAAPASPTAGGETLLFTLPPGWKVLHSVDGDSLSRGVFIPNAQDGNSWKDMVVVTMARGSDAPDIKQTYQRTVGAYEKTCQAHTAAVPQTEVKNGVGRAFWTLGCHRRKDMSFGEASFFLFLQGREGAYLVQRIWRTAPFGNEGPPITGPERDQAIALLKTVRLCDPKRGDRCPANAGAK
ncbi:hypothetical protein [Rhodospirillum rubrum]|uniref:Uncharacterized protein n=1 Tax=Rhodospirillum rubrum (strain ATCC 11170 / ATH 1.1.1 / DSM 467 / LMG 4362 / NCIMB 8255 / S1) TaxID=269796 RepID=Q2RNB1_RHORT|nr:hypothetical protein [Rhodospirillum rubrum]ABC24384.1 hypothetical protein Rru_A3590 [Rhodospirillum rubrum ATCC 11170]AEO50135.1 hypothetical protein F11_18375 [Rhodospirillum rubrum F11]MBK5956104.1 hypothetical protein [Rhodospirillum rubrum]QXG80308.1 hypothetical protein KUL73_18530 [Rhodospirillum rubrum]HAQ00452.1 hypothetical protein [Rhodospirillum rubrum]